MIVAFTLQLLHSVLFPSVEAGWLYFHSVNETMSLNLKNNK